MNSAPLVTFVVPCYNAAGLLAKSVNSILAQNYEHFEVLILDNCSSDGTPDVARSLQDPRIRYIRNESNLGHVRNFNKGLELAQGKYIWVLCVDDMLRSTSVLRQYVEAMEGNANLGLVFCRAVELEEDKEGSLVRWADCGDQDRTWHDSTFFLRLIESNCMVMSSVMMRKESVDHVGYFPTDLPFACDWHVWSMIALQYEVAYFAEPMVFFRHHAGSLTSTYGKDYARICVGDELSVIWQVGNEAKGLGKESLHSASLAAFVRRSDDHLMGGLRGATPRISATEFEEILQSRIQDLNGIQQLRAAVYSNLAGEIEKLPSFGAPTFGLVDELSAFWDLWHRAELAGCYSLQEACKRALVDTLSNRLQGTAGYPSQDLTGEEFVDIVRSRVTDQSAANELVALVCRKEGDYRYTLGEHSKAKQLYRLALRARPGHPATLMKYLLLRMGHPGIWIRQLSHEMRESGRRV